MFSYQEAERFIAEGKSVRRHAWPACKSIRKWKDSDHDYFMTEFTTEGVIIQDCPQACECSISIYIKEKADIEASDWIAI